MADARSLAFGFIGAGRLAASLAGGLIAAGYEVRAIASANEDSARALARNVGNGVTARTSAQAGAVCDVVFLTVPDSAIETACAAVRWGPHHSVVHCSGALGLGALAAASAAGAAVGCFHPLQTFPSRTPEPERFRGISCGIEGEGTTGSMLEQIARDLGATPFRLEGVDRALYHASAVAASNFAVALMSLATRLWAQAGLPEAAGRAALSPLLLAAARNVSERELAEALTGPVARGDIATIEGHLAALGGQPELLELYRALSAELLRLPLMHSPETYARLKALLAPTDSAGA